jgi:hypothetical protein
MTPQSEIKWVARLAGFDAKYKYKRETFANRFPYTARCDSVYECRYVDGSSKFFAMRQNEAEPHEIYEHDAVGVLKGELSVRKDVLKKVGFVSGRTPKLKPAPQQFMTLGDEDTL